MSLSRSSVATLGPWMFVLVLAGCGASTTPTDGGTGGGDGSTSTACTGFNCGQGTCDASSGSAVCVCNHGWQGTLCDACAPGWAGTNCDTCAPHFAGINCDACTTGWAGAACDTCAQGWAGAVCDTCAKGWSGAACDTCAKGWSGASCDVCALGYVSKASDCIPGLADKTNLVLWLDATDYSTQTMVALGGSSYALSEWRDKAGGATVFKNTDASNATRPTLDPAVAINGTPTVLFDGNDRLISTNMTGLSGKNAFTVFIVGYSTADDSGCFLGGHYLGKSGLRVRSLNTNRLIFYHDGDFNEMASDSLTTVTNTVPVSRATAQLMTFFRRNSPVEEQGARVDGVQQLLGTAFQSVAYTQNFDEARIGDCPDLVNDTLTGQIGEILVFADNVSDSSIKAVEAYLKAKWGL